MWYTFVSCPSSSGSCWMLLLCRSSRFRVVSLPMEGGTTVSLFSERSLTVSNRQQKRQQQQQHCSTSTSAMGREAHRIMELYCERTRFVIQPAVNRLEPQHVCCQGNLLPAYSHCMPMDFIPATNATKRDSSVSRFGI